MLGWNELDAACKSKTGDAVGVPSTTWEQSSIQGSEEVSTSDEQCPQSSRSTSDDDEETLAKLAKRQEHDIKHSEQEPPQSSDSTIEPGQSQRRRSLSAKSGRVRRQRSRSSVSPCLQGQVSALSESACMPLQGNTPPGLQSQRQCSKRSRSNLFRRMQDLHRTLKERALTSESEKEEEHRRLRPSQSISSVRPANVGHAVELQASTDVLSSSEAEKDNRQSSQLQRRSHALGCSGASLRSLIEHQALHEVPIPETDKGDDQLPKHQRQNFVLGDAGGDLSNLEELRALSRASASADGEQGDEEQPQLQRWSWCLKDSCAASGGIQRRESSNARRIPTDIERKHLYLSKCQNLILSRRSGALEKLKELRALQQLTAPSQKLSSFVSRLPRFGHEEEKKGGERMETGEKQQVCSEELLSEMSSNSDGSSSCLQPSSPLECLVRRHSEVEARERDVTDQEVREIMTPEESEARQHEEQAGEERAEQVAENLDRTERLSRRQSEPEPREQAARAVDSQNDKDREDNQLKKLEEREAKERAEQLARQIERADAEIFVAAFRQKRMARRRSEQEEKTTGSP
eukprot:TRINITY_DN32676_c0_g1_i1.p1 TRINITY_DN32676_c0_g1~~TRINITY_DN32676_c0_g1_i1.p1  ORF type:complete len:576 (-),score=121.46 TRINITY_DN32676_c0_g1_i1:75-1802(-)